METTGCHTCILCQLRTSRLMLRYFSSKIGVSTDIPAWSIIEQHLLKQNLPTKHHYGQKNVKTAETIRNNCPFLHVPQPGRVRQRWVAVVAHVVGKPWESCFGAAHMSAFSLVWTRQRTWHEQGGVGFKSRVKTKLKVERHIGSQDLSSLQQLLDHSYW